MGTTGYPSDYSFDENVNGVATYTIASGFFTGAYDKGVGFYTDFASVADMLQISHFSDTSYPSRAQVGKIIKRIEGTVDETVKRSYRPIITRDEFHDFQFKNLPMNTYYGGYVGFIQLPTLKVRKIVSLQVWQGSQYEELASAQAQIRLLENHTEIKIITLKTPNSTYSFNLESSNKIVTTSSPRLLDSEFNNAFGIKTTVNEIISLINEEKPSKTQSFTKARNHKSLLDTTNQLSISDFFYASKDKSSGSNILISSLLAGDDGSDCLVEITTQQTCTTSLSSANLTVADSSKLAVGMAVSGTGITGTKTISSITDATTVVLDSGSGITAGTNTLNFVSTNQDIPTVCSVSRFTDKEDVRRLGDFWTIADEGRIFFMQEYPFHSKNSIIVTYEAGDSRVPAQIHEATTKLVAAEILRHDDQSILVAETGANISTKEKYDILRKEAMETLNGKKDLVYFLD